MRTSRTRARQSARNPRVARARPLARSSREVCACHPCCRTSATPSARWAARRGSRWSSSSRWPSASAPTPPSSRCSIRWCCGRWPCAAPERARPARRARARSAAATDAGPRVLAPDVPRPPAGRRPGSARWSPAAPASVAFRVGDTSERVIAEMVSGNTFEVLGARPALGRFFTAAEDDVSRAAIRVDRAERRVLAPALQPRAGGRRPVGGGQRHADDHHRRRAAPASTGVLANEQPAFFVPTTMKAQMTPTRDDLDDRQSRWLNVVGRLAPGVEPRAGQGRRRRALPADQRRRARVGAAVRRLVRRVQGTLPRQDPGAARRLARAVADPRRLHAGRWRC